MHGALLLDVDPVGLIRRGVRFPRLDQYVNDRLYIAYAAFMTGDYPPFRLDAGPREQGSR